jgi:hypothetical protein
MLRAFIALFLRKKRRATDVVLLEVRRESGEKVVPLTKARELLVGRASLVAEERS